jgi:hypothetical protein
MLQNDELLRIARAVCEEKSILWEGPIKIWHCRRSVLYRLLYGRWNTTVVMTMDDGSHAKFGRARIVIDTDTGEVLHTGYQMR